MALAVGFTALLDDVLEGEGIAQVDEPITHMLAGHREVWLTKLLVVITRLGNVDAQTVWLRWWCAVEQRLSARSWVPILVGVGAVAWDRRRDRDRQSLSRSATASLTVCSDARGWVFISLRSCHQRLRSDYWGYTDEATAVRRWAVQVTGVDTDRRHDRHDWLFALLSRRAFRHRRAGSWLSGAAWAVSVVLLAAWWPRAVSARRGLTQRGQ